MANRYVLLASGLTLAALTLDGHEAWAQVGTLKKFSATRAVVNDCTITDSFTNMPGMSRTFTISGTSNEEVVVMFQASWSGSDPIQFDNAFVRLTIDNVVQPTNVSVGIFAGANGVYTHGFTWVSGPLAPGSHTARMQWRTDLGSEFCVDDRTLVVLHK